MNFKHSSKETWQERLVLGQISLEGRVILQDTFPVAGGVVSWARPPWQEPIVPTNFAILHQDADFLAVYKPAGLPTMPAGGFLQNTLLSFVRKNHPTASPMHRLGRGTSGVVLFSLNTTAASLMLLLWRSHGVCKSYLALVSGVAGKSLLGGIEINTPIAKASHPKLGSIYVAAKEGKPARSVAKALKIVNTNTLCQIEIYTGRPHQIRIHMASIGHPLVGDPLYIAGGSALPNAVPSDTGYFLHARTLSFKHPITFKEVTITADPPPELR